MNLRWITDPRWVEGRAVLYDDRNLPVANILRCAGRYYVVVDRIEGYYDTREEAKAMAVAIYRLNSSN